MDRRTFDHFTMLTLYYADCIKVNIFLKDRKIGQYLNFTAVSFRNHTTYANETCYFCSSGCRAISAARARFLQQIRRPTTLLSVNGTDRQTFTFLRRLLRANIRHRQPPLQDQRKKQTRTIPIVLLFANKNDAMLMMPIMT